MVRLLVLLPLLALVTVTMFTLRALWVGNVNMSFWKETWRALRMNHPVLGLLAPPAADEIDPFTGRNKRLRYLFVSLLVSISAALISFELAPDFVRAAAVCDELRALRETWDDQLHPPEGQCNAYCTASLHDMCRALGYKGSSLRFCLSTSGMTREQCESSCPGVPADARNNCSPIPECKCEMHMYDEAAHKCFVFSPEKERWEPGRCRYSTRCAVNCRITSHSRKGCASAIAGTVLPRAGAEVTMCSQQRMVDMFGKFKDLFAVPQCDVPTRLPPQSLALMQARHDGAQAAAKVEAAQAVQAAAPGRERGIDAGMVDTRAVGSDGGGRFGRVNPTLPIHSGADELIREQDAPSSLAASLSLPGSIDHKVPGGMGGAVGIGGTAMMATPGHDVANDVAAAAGDLAASGDAAASVVGTDISGPMSGGLLSEEDEGGGDDGGKFDEDDEDSIVDTRTEVDGAEDGIEDMNGAVRGGANGTNVAIVSTGSRHVNGSSVTDMIGRGGSGSGGGVWHQEASDSAPPPRLRTSNPLVGLLADTNQTSRIIRIIGPAWTRGGIGGIEAPAGERNEGSFIRAVYTGEQQLRLGVNEDGEGATNSTTTATTAITATGTVLANHSNQTIQTNRSAITTLKPVELRDSNDDNVPSQESQDNGTRAYGTTQRLEPPRHNGTTFASLLQRSVAALVSSTTMSTVTAVTTATATATTGPADEAGVGGARSTPFSREQYNSMSNSSNSSNSSSNSNSSSSHNFTGLQGGGRRRRMLLGDTDHQQQQQQRSRREAPPLHQRTVEQQQQQQQQQKARQQARASPETHDQTGPYVRGSVAARRDGNQPTDKTPLLEKRNKHRGRGRTSGNLVVASNLVGPKRRRHEDGKVFTSFSEHLHDHDSHAILDDLSHMDYASFWNASISLLPAGVGPHCGTL